MDELNKSNNEEITKKDDSERIDQNEYQVSNMQSNNNVKTQSKNPSLRGFVFITVGLVIVLSLFLLKDRVWNTSDKEVIQKMDEKDVFTGRKLVMSDGSGLYFYKDGTYEWYQVDEDKTDNYFRGTFELYNAKEAEEHIVNNLSEYSYSQEELNDYHERNSANALYSKENLYCIIINMNYSMIQGIESDNLTDSIPYMGYSDGTEYDLANMATANYLTITDAEDIK